MRNKMHWKHNFWPRTKTFMIFYIPRLIAVSGLIVVIITVALSLFMPEVKPVGIRLEDFRSIYVENSNGCQPIADYIKTQKEFPPVNEWRMPFRYDITAAKIKDFDLNANHPQFGFTDNKYDVVFGWSDVQCTIVGIKSNRETILKSIPMSDTGVIVNGKLARIYGDLSGIDPLNISTDYCDTSHFLETGSDYIVKIYGNYMGITGEIPTGQLAYFTIHGDIDLTQFGIAERFDSYKFILDNKNLPSSANKPSGPGGFGWFIAGDPIVGVIPHGGDKNSNNSNSISPITETFAIDANSVTISRPTGTLKIGNDPEIKLETLSTISNENLAFSPSWNNKETRFFITKDQSTNSVIINGYATNINLNGNQLSKIPWSQLPEYLTGGITGLLITSIGVLLSKKSTLFRNFFKPSTNQLPKGKFICETRSGFIIAGDLIRQPDQSSPYFVIQNAKRRVRDKENWEDVKELHVNEKEVELFYSTLV